MTTDDLLEAGRIACVASVRGAQAKERVHLREPVPDGDALWALRLALPALDAVVRMLLGGGKNGR